MTREEILAKSRNENKKEDERDIALKKKGESIAFTAGMVLCILLSFLELFLSDGSLLFYGCFTVYYGMLTVAEGFLSFATKRKKDIGLAVISFVFFVGFGIQLVLELLGGR